MTTNIRSANPSFQGLGLGKITFNSAIRLNLAEKKEAEDKDESSPVTLSHQLFQVLIVKDKEQSGDGLEPFHITTELIMGKSVELNQPVIEYNEESQSWQQQGTIGDRLPSQGVIVDPNFINHLEPNDQQLRLLTKSRIRYLLQSRKFSQILTKTWLPLDKQELAWEKDNLMNIRELILSVSLELDEPQDINSLFTSFGADVEKDYIITPEMRNFAGIRLNLLLAGQAYRYVPENKYGNNPEGYILISEPIMSTYEVVYEYAFRISWNQFFVSVEAKEDIIEIGQVKPPYFDVTIGYPSRPSLNEASTLTEEKLLAWAYAPDTESRFPFYPSKTNDGNYTSEELEYVVPPYPYIPSTCT